MKKTRTGNSISGDVVSKKKIRNSNIRGSEKP